MSSLKLLHLDDITFLDDGEFLFLIFRVGVKGGVVTDDFVNGNTNGESGSLFDFLLGVALSQLI